MAHKPKFFRTFAVDFFTSTIQYTRNETIQQDCLYRAARDYGSVSVARLCARLRSRRKLGDTTSSTILRIDICPRLRQDIPEVQQKNVEISAAILSSGTRLRHEPASVTAIGERRNGIHHHISARHNAHRLVHRA